MGMRKDFILTEGEKQRRRKRLDENQNLTSQHVSNSESVPQAIDEIGHVSYFFA
jgi:hypothetical protein